MLPMALAVQTACTTGPAEEAVIARRTEFNEAIARSDLNVIETVLAPSVIGRNGELLLGDRETQLQFWAGLFAEGPERPTFHRSTDCVVASSIRAYALEYGSWTGWIIGAPDEGGVSGRYTAQWVEVDGVWKLYGELFLSMECEGSLCANSSPTED